MSQGLIDEDFHAGRTWALAGSGAWYLPCQPPTWFFCSPALSMSRKQTIIISSPAHSSWSKLLLSLIHAAALASHLFWAEREPPCPVCSCCSMC